MTLVKICGVTDPGICLAAVGAGADFIGLVFAPSRRKVKPDVAGALSRLVHYSRPGVEVIGIFANQPVTEVNQTAREYDLDRVQLSGDESWEYCARISRPVIKAIRISDKTGPDAVRSAIGQGFERLGNGLIVLLDTAVPGTFGGTGQTFPWEAAREFIGRERIMIAGGLGPENIGSLVREFDPWGVDVSSGVETNGAKDILKISDFVLYAKSMSGRKPDAGHNEK
jgi:phosphoribosylanthranilate isomerase